LLHQESEGFDQPSNICGRNRLFVYKDYASVDLALFGPPFQQRRDRSPIVCDQSQSLNRSLLQAHNIFLPEKLPVSPFGHATDHEPWSAAAQARRYIWRKVLIQKKLQHASAASLLFRQ
jgi:hypothetical protein